MNETKNSITNSTEMVAIPLVKLDNLIAAVEQLKAGKLRPLMYAIQGPAGEAHIDENCVAGDPATLAIEVNRLNDSPDAGYQIVPVYLGAPPAEQPTPVQGQNQAAEFAAFQTYFNSISSARKTERCRSAALAAWREATRRAEDRLNRAGPVPAVSVQPGAFPERDQSQSAERQGVFHKFDVRRVDGSDAPGGKHHGCRYFVLDMDHDQHAGPALAAYAASCAATHPALSAELAAEFGQPDSGRDAALVALMREAAFMLQNSMFQFCDTGDKALDLARRIHEALAANVAQVEELSDAQITQALKIT